MDLAKIRKKYRQPPAETSPLRIIPENESALSASSLSETVTLQCVSPEADFFNSIIPGGAANVSAAALFPEGSYSYRNPIEMILAGRKAAGCDEESPEDADLAQTDSEECLEYLCFRVSDEIYGINIMDIKEIIKPREVTEIPRAPKFVSGIISLRGTIIPIIDMRARLGLSREHVIGKDRVVIIKCDQSFSGLLVDEVIQVVRINKENMEPAPSVLEGIDRDFVNGIGRSGGRLIIILNLRSVADLHLF